MSLFQGIRNGLDPYLMVTPGQDPDPGSLTPSIPIANIVIRKSSRKTLIAFAKMTVTMIC
jgi:hypothetical protein